jgi:hypothetical protein
MYLIIQAYVKSSEGIAGLASKYRRKTKCIFPLKILEFKCLVLLFVKQLLSSILVMPSVLFFVLVIFCTWSHVFAQGLPQILILVFRPPA